MLVDSCGWLEAFAERTGWVPCQRRKRKMFCRPAVAFAVIRSFSSRAVVRLTAPSDSVLFLGSISNKVSLKGKMLGLSTIVCKAATTLQTALAKVNLKITPLRIPSIVAQVTARGCLKPLAAPVYTKDR